MNMLPELVQQSYKTLLQYAQNARIILLHPHSRYRSLVVANLLAEAPQPVFYYAMGAYDVNLASFLSGFIHDLAGQAPMFGQHVYALGGDLLTQDSELLLDKLRQDIAELSNTPFFLILDDYDACENAHDVHEFLEKLLMGLPSHCQIVISSRSLPRLPWVALVALGEAIILNDAALVMHDPYNLSKGGELGTLVVRGLGTGTVEKNGKAITQWEGHLPRLLFIFTLERPVVTRSEICQAFWTKLDIDQAVNVFHVTKRRLHKALGFDALVHHDGYYKANPLVEIHYDVVDFVGALVEGRITNDITAWQRAVDLYQGPFLQGHTEDWIISQRQAYQIGYFEATIAVAAHDVREARPERALRQLLQVAGDTVDYEPLHQEIMRLYADLGRRSEAAAHYQWLLDTLHTKNLQPSPQLQQLYQEIMT